MLEGEPLEASRDKLRAAVARHADLLGHRDEVRICHFLGELTGAPFEPLRAGAGSDEDDDSLQIRAARRDRAPAREWTGPRSCLASLRCRS